MEWRSVRLWAAVVGAIALIATGFVLVSPPQPGALGQNATPMVPSGAPSEAGSAQVQRVPASGVEDGQVRSADGSTGAVTVVILVVLAVAAVVLVLWWQFRWRPRDRD